MRLSSTGRLTLGIAAIAGSFGVEATQKTKSLTSNAQSLFDWSMYINDIRFDKTYKYVEYPDNGPWSTRFTAWYVAGLLYRKNGSDIADAKAAIENIISCQLTESYESAWYGTYKLSPDEPDPTPDSDLYPPSIYDTYDPNWREFIGTQFVQILEEFSDLLGSDLVGRIEDSLEVAAVGSMRRNGSYPEDDNLTPAYTNPGIMRAWYVGWIGMRRNNQTMVDYANDQGNTIFALFKSLGSDVVSEYNAPTYYGMDIWALAGCIKYGAKNSTMKNNAGYMLTKLWEDVADHYNPYLSNLVGPYDRANSRDLTYNSAVLSYFWWGLYGYGVGPQPNKEELNLLYDVAQGAALALIMDTIANHISRDTAAKLSATGPWEGERLIIKDIPDELGVDAKHRIATSWISSPLMIGGQQVNETVARSKQYVPAIVHWAGDEEHKPSPYVTYFYLYPTASTIHAVAGNRSLEISYPNTTQDGTDIFTFGLAQVPPSWTLNKKKVISGFTDLPCLQVNLDAPGLEQQPVVYGTTIYDNRIYNMSWTVPSGFEGTPKMSFTFEYTC